LAIAVASTTAPALAAVAVSTVAEIGAAVVTDGLAGVGLTTNTGCATTDLPPTEVLLIGGQNARPRIRVSAVAPAPAPSPIRLGICALLSLRRTAQFHQALIEFVGICAARPLARTRSGLSR